MKNLFRKLVETVSPKKLLNIFLQNFVGSAGLLFALITFVTYASAAQLTTTPVNLAADDLSYLRAQLISTDTSLTLDPLEKWVNGVKIDSCFDTDKGFILIQDSLGRKEWASYGTKSCSSDYITTLSDLRRGLSPQTAAFGSGTGLDFDAGAQVRVVDYPLIYNNTVYKDVANLLSASGALSFTGSGSFAPPTFATTTARDQQMGSTGDEIRMACVQDTDLCYLRLGGVWLEIGDNGTENATEITSGKVELATIDEQRLATETGSTGAPLVPQAKNLTLTGGVASAWYIPILNSIGLLDSSVVPATGGDALIFGDASDGNVSITGSTTLTRDMFYNDLTFSNNATLNTGGFRIFVAGILSGSGTIQAPTGGTGGNGGNASANTAGAAGTGGSATASGSLPSGLAGLPGKIGAAGRTTLGPGTAASPGSQGTSVTNSLATISKSATGAITARSGTGGAVHGGGGGYAAGASGKPGTGGTLITLGRTTISNYISWYTNIGASFTSIRGIGGPGSTPGGGGGGNAANDSVSGGGGGGGGGGGQGGYGLVAARTISGTINFKSLGGTGGAGGTGGNGSNGSGGADSCGAGGGGGAGGSGGSGGAWVLIKQISSSWTGIFVLTGGTGGAAGSAGVSSGNCLAPSAGGTGVTGTTGISLTIDI